MLEVLYHLAKFGRLGFHPPLGRPKTVSFFCLFVCVSVTLLNDRVCVHNFAMKPLQYRNYFDTVGYLPLWPGGLNH